MAEEQHSLHGDEDGAGQETAQQEQSAEAQTPPENSAPAAEQEAGSALKDELVRMRMFHDWSFTAVRSALDSIRQNGEVPVQELNCVVNAVVDSVERNPCALLCMKGLQDAELYTCFHSINVATIAVVFGHFLGYSSQQLQEIGQAGILHDIGKQRIPQEVLNAPRRLTSKEFDLVKKHPVLGYELLRSDDRISEKVKMAVLQHHETQDGTGYPLGIEGEKLSEYASMLSLADVYDALTSNRPYKRAFPQNKTAAMLYKMGGTVFSADLAGQFIRCFGVYPVGSLVCLNDGNYGIVCENHTDDLLRPKVLLLVRSLGRFLFSRPREMDLREEKDCTIVSCEDVQKYKLDVQMVFQNFLRKTNH